MAIPSSLLPRAGAEVTPELFNSLVRSLQIIFGQINLNESPSYTTAQRDSLQFNAGAIIYNLTTSKHQGFDGSTWYDLY